MTTYAISVEICSIATRERAEEIARMLVEHLPPVDGAYIVISEYRVAPRPAPPECFQGQPPVTVATLESRVGTSRR